MSGAGVHVAFVQRGEHVHRVGEAVHAVHLLHAGHLMLQKQLLRLGGALHGDALAVQVAKTVNVAGRLHHDYLTAVHIRPCPAVAVLSAVHGEAAPQAVHLSVRKQPVLLLPGYLPEVRRPPQALTGRLGDLHVDTRIGAIFIQIEIWLIVVAANDQHRQFFRFRLPLSAAAQQRAAQRQQHRQQSFYPAHSLPLRPYTSRHSAPCMSSRQSTSSGSNAPHSPRRIIANASAWVYAGLYTRWLTSES